ncbi:Bax inhibitor-1/YccA family protein [Lacticaseibacillus parahuelsenbergensis]|uniref:Bax inhibitor-1/YccA family protein n=1 Tax=Lacticaseibacillus parahuelsenbergensis TaxID=3068305 RepID=A0ABY9KZN3_9LACO|nr:Bax inhibitor-1/YccA family protein [Lacticaseibacillus sp. NCIMB 15471]WLV76889.1 Bax inhibitor-1/YccA family protein [Lacticaseibacillus sp. NCIMB 15471]
MQERRVVNEAGLTQFFSRIYTLMGSGLIVTALVSYLLGVTFKTDYVNFVSGHQIVFWIMLALPLILSFFVTGRRAQASPGYATLMFYLMSASFGFTFASVAMVARTSNLAVALATTAVVFLVMSMVGHFGKRDLSKAGNIAIVALVGVILMSLVNMFMGSGGIQMLISYAVLIIFIVLTAWDTQRLKNLYLTTGSDGQAAISENSLAVVGALMLYLDFLNLFTAILQILGVGNNNN